MLRRFALAISFITALVAGAQADTALTMPPGTRKTDAGQLVSGRGLRETTEYFAKQLTRLGVANRQIGPYRFRGADLTRFLSDSPSTTWLAIHILRTAGKTLIFVVPRAGT